MGIRNRKPRIKAHAARVAADAAAREEARQIVERFNAELRSGRELPLWSPSIRCALVAGHPWLDLYCPGCGTSRAIDIRTIDRHPEASVVALVLGLRCSWCRGNAPMPRLLGLYELPPTVAGSEVSGT
jgi:hypothetical protein